MKVDGPVRAATLTGVTNQAPASGKKTADNVPQRDSVNLSDASSQMQALETSVNQAPAIDVAKVEATKQAISEDRFKINPEKIADGLLASARELIAQPKG